MTKTDIHIAAASLTAACLSSGGSGLLPDGTAPGTLKADVKARNLQVWEVHRVFYHAIYGTLGSADWPEPTSAAVANPPAILNGLLETAADMAAPGLGTLIAALSPLAKQALTKLVASITVPAKDVASTLPVAAATTS